MNKIKSFLKLDFNEKLILIRALFLLWIVRIMLWIFPFSLLQKIIARWTVIYEKKISKISIERLTWAVIVMSIYTPRATCLVQAIAAQILLARYNYSSNIRIGVSKNEEEFEAHAWLEADEKIILGQSENEYLPILNMSKRIV